ncbi:hypothetical protein GCM10009682_58420 [Luedemannella flava]|uniref:Peptidase MA-like domain-containing protein n=1 Tax=Luedemannella flava TaxID=349316 RepID=A0ABN2MMQ1_9ACTN
MLEAQSRALINGDEAGWLDPVDPSNPELVAHYRALFARLRALQVGGWWQSTMDGKVTAATINYTHRVRVALYYSLREPLPRDVTSVMRHHRADMELWFVAPAGKLLISQLNPSDVDRRRPTPWEATDLTAVVGKRVLLAAGPALKDRLASALPIAEKAATIADRFAKWEPAPASYTVYLATAKEFKTWYGGHPKDTTSAYAMPVSDFAFDIVVDTSQVKTADLAETLRHEMGHVVTLRGAKYDTDVLGGKEWLTEGMAEYVAITGVGGRASDRIGSVRAHIRGGEWTGRVDGIPPYGDEATDAYYGISFLTFKYLADTYGQKKMYEFFNQARRQAKSVDQASRTVFGKPWESVQRACATYVRRVAS